MVGCNKELKTNSYGKKEEEGGTSGQRSKAGRNKQKQEIQNQMQRGNRHRSERSREV